MRRLLRVRSILLLLLLAFPLGCQAPGAVKVRARPPETPLIHDMYVNVLRSDGPSPRTEQILRRHDLDKRFNRDPLGVLATLDRKIHSRVDLEGPGFSERGGAPDPDIVFALAELNYLAGRKLQRRSKSVAMSLYGATVAYAYFYLFDEDVGSSLDRFDPRFRLACDLYNTALAQCLRLAQSQEIQLGKSLQFEFAEGTMEMEITRHGFLWQPEEFGHYLFARDYQIEGLNNQYSTYGLGVPLIAVRDLPRAEIGQGKYYPSHPSYPVTAFLRMNCNIADMRRGGVRHATLELYDPLRVQSTDVAGQQVPLESDLTTPLGYFLSKAKLERFELAGLLRVDKLEKRAGLFMLQPYEKGKIPVVMVHGIWSSPLAWMQMFNDLRGDPEIRDKYQFWFFLYPTGNPFLVSANILRNSLNEAIATVDPYGQDASIRQMVIVGHSMGGLLAKMMVQDSDEKLWELISKEPIDKIRAKPDQLEQIRQVYFFDRQPYVKRLVFIATPHRGSTLSDGFIGRLSSRLISLPKSLLDTQHQLLAKNPDAFLPMFANGIPTSVDNLSPESPIIQAVGKLPLGPDVKYHSIIGNVRGDEAKFSTDGVVPYSSSHIEGAVSEDLVPAGHACQNHPLTILAVRGILLEHLRQIDAEAPIRLATAPAYRSPGASEPEVEHVAPKEPVEHVAPPP